MRIELNKPSPILALALGLGLSLSVAGCADDTTPGAESSAGTETSDGDGDTDSTETGDSDSTTTGDGDGDATGDGDGDATGDGDGDPAPTEIVVGGQVTDFLAMSGIERANVSVKDVPGFETVSGADGVYEIPGMTPNSEVFFLIDGNEDTYWGGIRPALLPDSDIDDLELGQISNELIDIQLNIVMGQDDTVMKDETKAIVIVRLLQPTATGATVTFDPPLPMNQFYGVSAENNPTLGSNLIDSSLLPFWVGFNIDPDDVGGAYSIEVDHPERECTVLHPVFPTLERYVTLVDVDCPPMP